MEIKYNDKFTPKELVAINNLGKLPSKKSKSPIKHKHSVRTRVVNLQPFMTDEQWYASDKYKKLVQRIKTTKSMVIENTDNI